MILDHNNTQLIFPLLFLNNCSANNILNYGRIVALLYRSVKYYYNNYHCMPVVGTYFSDIVLYTLLRFWY